ncbi:hypothetical protein HK097_006524 [Rhizophlyctis rosea]|uniref:CBM1 domain-containing protein n=1 Tax=Rhizophlyctis rosea TaxID=64517 RepID=A0AAD5SE21_9FUNG|nr:hypothetical protein HK097_006524 [Rhizophlyctis rosea]
MQYTLASVFAILPLVAAHGQMLSPEVRKSSSAQNSDYLRNPLNLRTSPTGSPMEPCGGMSRGDSSTLATSVSPNQNLNVNWEIGLWTGLALHQGTIDIQISADGSESNWETLTTVDLNGKSTVEATPKDVNVKLPSSLGSNPVLRWYWKAGLTGETYINCADLTTNGGVSSGGNNNNNNNDWGNNNGGNSDNGNSNDNGGDNNNWNSNANTAWSNDNGTNNNNNGGSSSGHDNSGCQPQWAQCGGTAWTGSTCCQSGSSCKYDNEWYSQCQ